eukprot:SAG31_NODE_103_length_25164_cov_12.124317_14_plen_549_part_00
MSSCLGLYVGPSLHENLSWRIVAARRKLSLMQPGKPAHIHLCEAGLLRPPGTATVKDALSVVTQSDTNCLAPTDVGSSFACKGFLFDWLHTSAGRKSFRAWNVDVQNEFQSVYREEVTEFTPTYGAELNPAHCRGWWAEWTELKTLFDQQTATGHAKKVEGRWAVLTKQYWLSQAVAKRIEKTNVVEVEGDVAFGIGNLPTYESSKLHSELQAHYERVGNSRPPQPMMVAWLEPLIDSEGHTEAYFYVEASRGFVVADGWKEQAKATVLSTTGEPRVRREKDGAHTTMVCAGGGDSSSVLTETRSVSAVGIKPNHTKRAPRASPQPDDTPVVLPHALRGLERGGKAAAALREEIVLVDRKIDKGCRGLWIRRIIALFQEIENSPTQPDERAYEAWVSATIQSLNPEDKKDRTIVMLLLEASAALTHNFGHARTYEPPGPLRRLCENACAAGFACGGRWLNSAAQSPQSLERALCKNIAQPQTKSAAEFDELQNSETALPVARVAFQSIIWVSSATEVEHLLSQLKQEATMAASRNDYLLVCTCSDASI